MEALYKEEIKIPLGNITLTGELVVPPNAEGIIIFSNEGDISYKNAKNRIIAEYLRKNNFGTLLFNPLTEGESINNNNHFNISLLSKRLISVTEWVADLDIAQNCKLAYFGENTGAAVALKAASYLPYINALVSHSGRPDLVAELLHKIKAPTLLIVEGLDDEIVQLNRKALQELCYNKKLEVLQGISHLFEDPGAVNKVAALANNWFKRYLRTVKP